MIHFLNANADLTSQALQINCHLQLYDHLSFYQADLSQRRFILLPLLITYLK